MFNIVMAALAQPRKGIFNYHQHSYSEAARRMCQRGLISAQKFTICDSLLEHAVVASFVRPKALIDMCEIGIPCFHNMWIEWDETKRMDLLIHYGKKYKYFPKDYNWTPEVWGERVGYHIFDEPPKPYFCYSQYTLKDDQIFLPPMTFVMNNEEILDLKVIAPEFSASHTREQQKRFGKTVIGNQYVDYHNGSPQLDNLYNRMMFSISNTGNMILPKQLAANRGYSENLAIESAKMYAGDMRFLIAVMALLNYPHTVKERKLEPGPQRFMFGKKLPRNELRVVEIDLPKPRGVTRYERMFKGGGGKKRRHVRRGHWHTYVFKNGERIKKWVEEQWCGDAALGTITHDYELKNKQSPKEKKKPA